MTGERRYFMVCGINTAIKPGIAYSIDPIVTALHLSC